MNNVNKKIIIGIVIGVVIVIQLIPKVLDVNIIVKQYLKENEISSYKVYKIDDYKSINYKKRNPTITQKDIDQFIKEDLEAREESVEVKDRDYVKKGDVVSVTYAVYMNGKRVNYVNDDAFMVGKGKYNSQIEKNVIGKRKNQKIVFDIRVPKDDYNKSFAGKVETVKLYIKSISIVKTYEFNTEFVSKFYGLDTLDEYYEYVKKELESKNTYESKSIERKEILSKLSKCFKYNLSKEEIAKYSVNIIEEYSEMASVYNKTLDKYREENLDMTEDEFMNRCYNEGKERIEQYIAIGVVSQLENISVVKNEENIEALMNGLIDKTITVLKTNYLE